MTTTLPAARSLFGKQVGSRHMLQNLQAGDEIEGMLGLPLQEICPDGNDARPIIRILRSTETLSSIWGNQSRQGQAAEPTSSMEAASLLNPCASTRTT